MPLAPVAPAHPPPRADTVRRWLATLLLFTVYIANNRHIGAGDVVPASLLPVAILRGDGLVLDRFDHLLRTPAGAIPGYAEEARGHIVPRYPLGPSLVAVPFYAPQLLWFDIAQPGWEARADLARRATQRMSKNAAAAIAALAAIALFSWLTSPSGLNLSRAPAAVATTALAFGSNHWVVASQALWQHGPAVLMLVGMISLLTSPEPRAASQSQPQPQPSHPPPRTNPSSSPASPGRIPCAAAGVLGGLMVACRPIDAIIVLALWLWALAHLDRPRRWAFTLAGAAVGTALLAYNLYFFDVPLGGYAAIEQMHPWAHGTTGTWTTPLLDGLAGTLLSPSHGLLVYSPWIALAIPLGTLALRRNRLSRPLHALGLALAASLLPTLVLLSKYSCWWGGHCFGPRFWVDSGPIFALLLALGLDQFQPAPHDHGHHRHRHARATLAVLLALTLLGSIALQTIGAIGYPSTWHGRPTNADRDHSRLWDWRDNEITRAWAEGPRPPHW